LERASLARSPTGKQLYVSNYGEPSRIAGSVSDSNQANHLTVIDITPQ
jgi:hypothetical protein